MGRVSGTGKGKAAFSRPPFRAIILCDEENSCMYFHFDISLHSFFLLRKVSVRKPAERFDPEKTFTAANEQFEKKEYEQARASFLEVKNRDMTKKYAPLAQLKIADSYVKEEEPELAVAEYRKFLEAYPDHQYASYAQYQIAMVYFDQIEGSERGYGGAAKALEEFEKLKTLYPRNPYKDVVDLKMEKCRNTIAEYEYLVGKVLLQERVLQCRPGQIRGTAEEISGLQGRTRSPLLFRNGL